MATLHDAKFGLLRILADDTADAVLPSTNLPTSTRYQPIRYRCSYTSTLPGRQTQGHNTRHCPYEPSSCSARTVTITTRSCPQRCHRFCIVVVPHECLGL